MSKKHHPDRGGAKVPLGGQRLWSSASRKAPKRARSRAAAGGSFFIDEVWSGWITYTTFV